MINEFETQKTHNTHKIQDLEEQLLFACSRTTLSPETTATINDLLKRELDWKRILELAKRHGVRPLLYQAMKREYWPMAPDVVYRDLTAINTRIVHQNIYLTAQMIELLGLLEQYGIVAFPFKGPMLAIQAYGDLALREFGDIDLFIRSADFSGARHALLDQGFSPVYTEAIRSSEEAKTHPDRYHDYRLVRSKDGLVVDLQWQVIRHPYPFPADPEAWWDRLEQASLGGRSFLAFNKFDLLIILCVHGSKHFWNRLIWICDIAELCRQFQPHEWQQLVQRAQAVGASRMLRLGLLLAHDVMGISLPPEVSKWIAVDKAVRWLSLMAIGQLRNDEGLSPDVHKHRRLYYVAMLSRLSDKARACLTLAPGLLHPTDFLKTYRGVKLIDFCKAILQ